MANIFAQKKAELELTVNEANGAVQLTIRTLWSDGSTSKRVVQSRYLDNVTPITDQVAAVFTASYAAANA